MKRFLLYTLLVLPFIIQSCTETVIGPQGPAGLDGRDGVDGRDGDEAFVFEYEFSFNRNDYREFLELPEDFTLLESDVALVYFLWEVDDNGREIWRLLPQTVFTPEGTLQFNFDHTRVDASVFLEANFNLDLVGNNLLDDWIARLVVIPGEFEGRIDYSDYDAIKEQFQLEDTKADLTGFDNKPGL